MTLNQSAHQVFNTDRVVASPKRNDSQPLPMPSAPILIDRIEAARLLGVSPGTIDNLRLRGELPSVKIAARRLYDVVDLHRFIESRKAMD